MFCRSTQDPFHGFCRAGELERHNVWVGVGGWVTVEMLGSLCDKMTINKAYSSNQKVDS